MVTRVLLAVTIAAALLAASLPAIEAVRTDRTAAHLDREATRIETASSSLLANDEAEAGARRVLSISLPQGSLSAAGVNRFIIRCQKHCVVRYRITGSESHARQLQIPLSTPAGAVALSTPGPHRLVLGLAREDGRRVVTVRG